MPPRQKRQGGPADFGGLDPAMMRAIASKVPKNPVTGRVDLNDIAKYMTEHPEDLETVESAMRASASDAPPVDLDTFDYAGLKSTIVHESFWVFQLDHMGIVDSKGRPVPDERAHLVPDARPAFTIYCYDDKGAFRIMHECQGLPTADDLFTAVRTAILKPLPPSRPSLPWDLMISSRLIPHLALARPFLESLPAPFHWRIETAEQAEEVSEGVHQKNVEVVSKGRKLGADEKAVGNAAFAKQDRKGAIAAYSRAVDAYVEALSSKPDAASEKDSKRQLAICLANRAAAHLLAGEGVDAQAALEDGEAAAKVDPTYVKAYIRQASAYLQLQAKGKALDVIARAMQRPELANDRGLIEWRRQIDDVPAS